MKKILIILLVFVTQALSLGPLKFGIQAGISTPNDQINNVYNRENLNLFITDNGSTDTSTVGLLQEGLSNGYHLNAQLRISLSNDFSLIGTFGFHTFPEAITVVDLPENVGSVTLNTTQRILPVTAGLMYHFLEISILEFYVRGETQVNYIAYQTQFNFQVAQGVEVGLPIADTGSVMRLGAGLGGGIDFDLKLIRLNLDIRYNMANLLLTEESGEEAKNFLSLGVGVLF